ncbi:hypothetical protein DL96DRAFT_1815823 [Flagelloscypha sp. PMI_526]|nr:hypothetical protein DL96DRAFT_1815823 [Flagelloscypha sp. PMI_526]
MSEDTTGLTVLSIDGASRHQSGVVPPLLILQEIASRYETDKESLPGSFRANKTFQLIGGVGDGGLLALMLGHFGIGVNDAIREYRRILKAVHQHSDGASWSKDERSQKFEAALRALVASKTSPSDENYPLIKSEEENPRCKVFVTAMHALNLQHPILLRTYRSRIDTDPPKCTIVEAIRATTAMPDLFTPVTLGPPHRQIDYFSSACHGFNNPIDQVRQEAKAAFPGRSISCIISLGCGHPGPVQIRDATEDSTRAVVQLAMDSVRAAEQTYRRLVGIPNLYFRFDVPYGLERAVLKLNPTLSEIRAHITTYVGEEQTSDRLDSAVKQLIERPLSIETSELDGILPVETTVTVWVKKCPLPSPNFTGRRDELDHMHAYFSSSVGSSPHIYIIYGLGGSGKTQLLLQFVLECQTNSPRMFDVVYFADASLESTLETDLKAIAIDQKIGETAADAVRWLSCQTNRWLLVLDNADDKKYSIQKYIPTSIHGNVIITSRNPELSGLTTRDSGSRRIENLEKWAAEVLLKKLVGAKGKPTDDDDSLVTQAVEMLHCFALAITQAGSYMSATGRGYQEYIELFGVERSRLLRERKGHVPDNYPWSVYTTWAISFDQLKTAPRHFMQVCSYLHHTGIPKDLFMRAAEAEPLEDVDEGAQIWLSEFMNHTRNSEGRWIPVAFDEMIQNVMSFSLIDYDSEMRLFSFHPLVHEWTREAIQFAYSQDFPDIQCALQLVALSAPITYDKSSASVLLNRRLLPHLDCLVPGALHVSSVPMVLRLSAIYEQTGRWNDLASIFERATDIGRSVGGWSIEACTNSLGLAYGRLGRHAEALELQLSVLAKLKQKLGDEHPKTLTIISNLAMTYQALGKYAEALDLQLSGLATTERIRGAGHPDTLSSMNSLASTYQALGKYQEALELHLSVLANQKQTLGDEHPNTLLSMGNLAETYHALGRHTEALDLHLQVLPCQQRILGDDHPDTLGSMGNLASTYHILGRHAEAFELQLSVLATLKQNLGDEHPETLSSMNNLAKTYQGLGMPTDALELQLSVLSNQKRTLGDEHPNTLSSMSNLAETYRSLGKHTGALDLQTSVLANQKRTLGDEHPDTLSSMSNLSMTYQTLERHAEALELQLSALETANRSLGDEHPTTLTIMSNLTLIYQALGRHEEAFDLQLSVLATRKRILGGEHPDTLLSMSNLASTYQTLERHSEALELHLSVLAFRKRTLGDEHPDTLLSMSNLAMSYQALGRHAEALNLQVPVLTHLTRILGDEHHYTLISTNNLALTYKHLGRHAEATDLLIPAVGVALRAFGAEHSITLNLESTLEQCLTHKPSEQVDDSFNEDLEIITAAIGQCEQEGKLEEAIEHGEIAVEAFSAMLGECHPKTILHVLNLAKNCTELSRFNDARGHIERAHRLIKDDRFSPEGHLDLVLMVEHLYSQVCLGTSTEAQLGLAEPQMNLVTAEEEREMDENLAQNLVPQVEDERTPQARAADAAEVRKKVLDNQSKDEKEVKHDTAAHSSTPAPRAQNSQNSSVVPLVANLATEPRARQPATHVPKRSQGAAWKGKARDRSSIPSDQNEQTAPVITTTRVDNPSVEQPEVEVSSSIVDTEQQAVTNTVHTQRVRTIDPQELDTSVSSHTAVASTSGALLPAETKGEMRRPEIAPSQARAPNLYNVPSEDGIHERYMAKMELKKMKLQAKSEKQERQCRLEMARMILFALVILGIQWRDTKTSGDE